MIDRSELVIIRKEDTISDYFIISSIIELVRRISVIKGKA